MNSESNQALERVVVKQEKNADDNLNKTNGNLTASTSKSNSPKAQKRPTMYEINSQSESKKPKLNKSANNGVSTNDETEEANNEQSKEPMETMSSSLETESSNAPISPNNEQVSPTNEPISPLDEPMSPTNEPISTLNEPVSPTNEPISPIHKETSEEIDEERDLYGDDDDDEVDKETDDNGKIILKEYPNPNDTLEANNLPLNLESVMIEFYDIATSLIQKRDLIEIKKKLTKNFKDISQIAKFPNTNVYKVVFLPVILYRMYSDLNKVLSNSEIIDEQRTLFHNCTIQSKCKDKITDQIELKLITIRKASQKFEINFGHLIQMSCITKSRSNDYVPFTTLKSYIGYVTQYKYKPIDLNNQCHRNHLTLLDESDRHVNKLILDEIIVKLKYNGDIYLRNDCLLTIKSLVNIHEYILQLKVLNYLDTLSTTPNLLKPNYVIKPSGLLIHLESTSNCENVQIDAIQKTIDFINNHSSNTASFIAYETSFPDYSNTVIFETIKQLNIFMNNREIKREKILLTAPNKHDLDDLIKMLTLSKLDVYLINSKSSEKLIKSRMKMRIGKLKEGVERAIEELNDDQCNNAEKQQQHNIERTKLLRMEKIYEEINRYLRDETCLSTNSYIEYVNLKSKINKDLINEFTIIAGTVKDLSHDLEFILTFNAKKMDCKFICSFLINGSRISETDMITLLWFQVDRFIFSVDKASEQQNQLEQVNGDSNDSNDSNDSDALLNKLGLKRSLSTRLSLIEKSIGSNENLIVIDLDN